MIEPTPATRREVEKSRREQGLPPTVADPATLAKIADWIDATETEEITITRETRHAAA